MEWHNYPHFNWIWGPSCIWPCAFCFPRACTCARLLGPCFKTGRKKPLGQQATPVWVPHRTEVWSGFGNKSALSMKTMEVSLGHGGISQMMVCHTVTWKPTLVAKKRFQVRKSSSCTSVRGGHGFYLMDIEMLGISPVLALQPKGSVIGHVPGYMATCIFQRFRGRKLGDSMESNLKNKYIKYSSTGIFQSTSAHPHHTGLNGTYLLSWFRGKKF